jgi:hypothetical protein
MLSRHTLFSVMALVLVLMLMVLSPARPALGQPGGQVGPEALEACRNGAFSTEEDFMSRGPEPPDGIPYISDGDLLSIDGQVCARNADLVEQFDVRDDMGLDAADILDFEEGLVAFSTELDSPHGNFTDGDLLFNNGTSIPNAALVLRFQIPYDIGLDAVHFVGERDRIRRLVEAAQGVNPDEWNQGALQELLEELDVDIWFSIEGTWPFFHNRPILDGDVLSARDGIVVLRQFQLLAPPIPAGIPNRGVDFGLDALAGEREPNREAVQFSTEILYRDEPSFTDGDVLQLGGAILIPHEKLIIPFEPLALFLGLDALVAPAPVVEPIITEIGGVSVANIAGGRVAPNAPMGADYGLTTLHTYLRRPFGRWVPIRGYIPNTPGDVDEFRVVYREAGTSRPASPSAATPIPVVAADGWRTRTGSPLCAGHSPWSSTSDGWYQAADFLSREANPCNTQLALTWWNSTDVSDPDGLYIVWLQWRATAGAIQEEGADHYVQFDNTEPQNLDLRTEGEQGYCEEYGPEDMPLMVRGTFDDPHFDYYSLTVIGGDPTMGPPQFGYPAVTWYPPMPFNIKSVDARANIDAGGTTGSLVELHPVDVADIPAFTEDPCCYAVRLIVEDSTIIHGWSFPLRQENDFTKTYGFRSDTYVTFGFAP